jgi:hypothetical protein
MHLEPCNKHMFRNRKHFWKWHLYATHKGKLQISWIQLKMETQATLKFKLSMQGLVASILVGANYIQIFFLPNNTNCTHISI